MKRMFALTAATLTLNGCAPDDGIEVGESDVAGSVEHAIDHVRAFPDLVVADRDHDFVGRGVLVEPDGREHVRLARLYKGLRVIGGDLIVHSRDGELESVTVGSNLPIQLATTPLLDPDAAILRAATELPGASTGAELAIYADANSAALAYEVVLEGMRGQLPSVLHVIVGAQGGEILARWDEIKTSSGRRPPPTETLPPNFNGRGYQVGEVEIGTTLISNGERELTDPARNNHATIDMFNTTTSGSVFTDADNVWGNGATTDRATLAVDAHYGAAMTFDFYRNTLGRNGIDGNGEVPTSRVHYGVDFNNAFWDGTTVTYGDGDGTVLPFTTLDVTGHEISHGMIDRTAGLTSSGESGALSESFADVFGTLIELYASQHGNTTDVPDYTIGERLFATGALRYMYRPSLDGVSPDCYSTGVAALDVHYSAGIGNHAFYLVAEGGGPNLISPTCPLGKTGLSSKTRVAGIGPDKAGLIWYRALAVYMTPSANYAAARSATVRAAIDLYGATSKEVNAVTAGWTAVGVN